MLFLFVLFSSWISYILGGKKIHSLIFHLSLPVLCVQLRICSRLQWLSFDGVSKTIAFLCPRFCLITGLEKLPFLPFSEQLVHIRKRARYLLVYTVTQLQTCGGSNPSALPLLVSEMSSLCLLTTYDKGDSISLVH